MCRLAGYYLTKRTPKNVATAKMRLQELVFLQEGGGSDATGFGFASGQKKFFVHKLALGAGEFLKDKETIKIFDTFNPRCMIAHCRLKTLGDQSNNKNNHPHFTKSGIITIHNGVVSNHAELFTKYGLIRDAEVDSEIIGKLIEYHQKTQGTTVLAIQEAFKELRGSIALAMVDAKEPDTLYLIRRENSLSVAFDSVTGAVFFATEKEALQQSLYDYETHLGFFRRCVNQSKIIVNEIPLKRGLKITKDKITTFEVETPAYQGYLNMNAYCFTHCGYFNSPNCKHTTNFDVEKDNKKYLLRQGMGHKNKKQEFVVKKSELDNSIRADFKTDETIKKPSKYTSAELEKRLETLLDLEHKESLTPLQQKEADRIESTLSNRFIKKDRQVLLNNHFDLKGGD